jgi:hypothetical protein
MGYNYPINDSITFAIFVSTLPWNYPFLHSAPVTVKADEEHKLEVTIRANKNSTAEIQMRRRDGSFWFVEKMKLTPEWQTFKLTLKPTVDEKDTLIFIGAFQEGTTYEIEKVDWEHTDNITDKPKKTSTVIAKKTDEKQNQAKIKTEPVKEPEQAVKAERESGGIELLKVTEFKNGYLPVYQPGDVSSSYRRGEDWGLFTEPGDKFTVTNPGNALLLDVQKRSDIAWTMQLLATGFSIQKSSRYLLEFEMKAAKPVTIRIDVKRNSPPNDGFKKRYPLKTEWNTFHEVLQFDKDIPDAHLAINYFEEGNVYELRRVSLRQNVPASFTLFHLRLFPLSII